MRYFFDAVILKRVRINIERKCIRMNRFLTRKKMGKREKRALDLAKRNIWEGISPVTRITENKKIYNRKKSPRPDELDGTGIFIFLSTDHPRGCSSGSLYSKKGMIETRQLAAGISVMERNTVFCILSVTVIPLW